MEPHGIHLGLENSHPPCASDAYLCETNKKFFYVTSVIMMIRGVYFTYGRMNCLLHGYLIYRFTSGCERVKLYCFLLFFSHGSSECIKIQNQMLYEIGGNIGKDSLTIFPLDSLITLKEM